jgi:hypothetical protein
MKGEFEAAFGDWPQAEFLEGETALHITGKYRVPSWWWQTGFPILLGIVMLIALPFSCFPFVENHTGGRGDSSNPGLLALYFIVGWFMLFMVVIGFFDYIGRRRMLSIKLSQDAIEIGGRKYAREIPHQYAIEEHEKAHDEESAARRGHGKDRIFRDAMQVVMRYGERRVPIAAFGRRDVRKAEALLVRLQLLDQGLEEMLETAAQGEAAAPGEGDDFGPSRPIR